MELSNEEKAILAYVVVEPDAWAKHAIETVGEVAVKIKIGKYRDGYLLQKDNKDYLTRAQREIVVTANMAKLKK
jgi:hypothetical protein